MTPGILIIWALTTIGLLIVTAIVPGIRAITTADLLIAALILGLINAFVRPLLLALTWPLTVLSFGLFALLVNKPPATSRWHEITHCKCGSG